MKICAFIFILLNAGIPALAATIHCDLLKVYSVDEHGALSESAFAEAAKTRQIVVQLDTGAIFHPVFGNDHHKTRKVIEQGDDANSTKIISYSETNRRFGTLEIITYSDAPASPFIAVSAGNEVGTGLCYGG